MVLSAWISNHDAGQRGVERVLGGRRLRRALPTCLQPTKREADDERAAGLDELPSGQRRAVDIDG